MKTNQEWINQLNSNTPSWTQTIREIKAEGLRQASGEAFILARTLVRGDETLSPHVELGLTQLIESLDKEAERLEKP